MSGDPSDYVAQCAHAIGTKAQCWYRPARVTAVTVQKRTPTEATIWIVTQSPRLMPAGVVTTSYRFFVRHMAQYTNPVMSTDGIARVIDAQLLPCSYYDVPGNVRDLAATVAYRCFGFPEIDLFK